MAIVGTELIVIAAVLLIVFLWGPKKIPEIARSLGEAKKEFEKAKRAYEDPVTSEDTEK